MDREAPVFRIRSNGKWAVVGPDHLVVPGETVVAARKDGTTSEVFVEDVSEPFYENGQRKVWGYIVDRPKPPTTGSLF
ncbi:hypothetical protein BH23ACT8_BH23ACT8_03110 [soil metagenome]